jgi:3-oxoacyl-[acyl-carrier-protein] synthase-3
MARLATNKVKISGVCCALPGEGRSIYEIGAPYFDEGTIRKTTGPIGVERIYTAPEGMTASDMCAHAAERLIEGLGWDRSDIGAIIFITQTPDYLMPATSGILQDRLGLKEDCAAYDLNLGCSAFVNGYFLAANLIEAGSCDKALLLIGDTLRSYVSPEDKGLTFIISDGGSATALERSEDAIRTSFIMKSDGAGYDSLIIPAGGARKPSDESTGARTDDGSGNRRGEDDMYMDGMGVFTFAVKRIPLLIDELSAHHGTPKEQVDCYLLHQANAYMLKYIAKRAGISMDKIPVNIGKYGNTNGSTIPFLLADLASAGGFDGLGGREVVMAGFGVGLSWGGAQTKLGALQYAEVSHL